VPKLLIKTLTITYVCTQSLCAGLILFYAHLLPDMVASHFDSAGQANASLEREQFIYTFLVLLVLTPGLIVLQPSIIKRLPNRLTKLEAGDHCLEVERVDKKVKTLQVLFLVLAIKLTCFLGSVYWLVLRANLSHPPMISMQYLMIVTSIFLLLIVCWATFWQSYFKVIH